MAGSHHMELERSLLIHYSKVDYSKRNFGLFRQVADHANMNRVTLKMSDSASAMATNIFSVLCISIRSAIALTTTQYDDILVSAIISGATYSDTSTYMHIHVYLVLALNQGKPPPEQKPHLLCRQRERDRNGRKEGQTVGLTHAYTYLILQSVISERTQHMNLRSSNDMMVERRGNELTKYD
uniref:Uncharacterized protein n=1 Tax=Glossina palpalis gambiensis TaxID=67801 RepID=A0A1B0B3X8_9MUSC